MEVKSVCFRCGAEGNSLWSRYYESLKRVKGDDMAEKIIDSFEENEVVFCDRCRTKFFLFLTGIEFFVPYDEYDFKMDEKGGRNDGGS